jgi:hypothetical protein
LALHLAETAAGIEKDDPFPVVAWSRILRELGRYEEAAGIFPRRYEKIKQSGKTSRPFFFEWGVALRESHRHCSATWLCGISLSDQAIVREWHSQYVPPMMRLAEMSINLIELHKKTEPRTSALHDPAAAQTFLHACAAAATLGLSDRAQENMPKEYDWKKSERSLKKGRQYAAGNGVTDVAPGDGINHIRDAIVLAWRLRESYENTPSQGEEGGLPGSLPAADGLTFRDLSTSLGIKATYKPEASSPSFIKPI